MFNRTLNPKRLQNILEDMEECISNMEATIESLDKYDAFVRGRLLRSFRPEITGFKELLGEYISHCLKTVSVSVNELTYLDGVRQAMELGYIHQEDYEFLVKLTKLRNRTAHGYNRPTEEELMQFFTKHKESFYNMYKTIKETKNSLENK